MFITDYHSLKQRLVRNPYPLPRMGNTIKYLEGFHYVAALDLNMGYYIIRLSPTSQYIMTIVTEFGLFKYNPISMDMCASGDIFQAKVDRLLSDIKGVKTYIDGILVLRKDLFSKHIEN